MISIFQKVHIEVQYNAVYSVSHPGGIVEVMFFFKLDHYTVGFACSCVVSHMHNAKACVKLP